jgi:hypothetical protein
MTHRKRRRLAALAPVIAVAVISGCGSTAPTGSGGSDPTAANHAKAVKFSECMRANGVSNFPDPGASGDLTIDQVANGSKFDTSSPAWQHAIGACKSLEPSGFTGSKRSAQQQSAARQFAQCIRHNGVPDFPDPTPNGPLVDTNRIPSAGTGAGMSALHAAMHKCGAIYGAELGLRSR